MNDPEINKTYILSYSVIYPIIQNIDELFVIFFSLVLKILQNLIEPNTVIKHANRKYKVDKTI